MGYDVETKCQHCGRSAGASFSYTSNLRPLFVFALGEGGISGLKGMRCADAIPKLRAAIAKCEVEPHLERFDAPNGWGTAAGAMEFMREILSACEQHPRDVIDVWA